MRPRPVAAFVQERLRRHRAGDGGSMSIEFVIITPMLLLLFGLIFLYGRVEQIDGTLQAGTRDAARAATQSQSYQQALVLAVQIISAEVASHSADCQNDVRQAGNVSITPQDFQPGAVVTVTAHCVYSTADIGLPFGGNLKASASFSSPLDPNRSVG